MGKSLDSGSHRRILLSSEAEARMYGGPTEDQDIAFTPALCERRVRRSLNGLLGVSL